MKKKYQEFINVFLLLTLYIGIFLFPQFIIESGTLAITIFKEKLFPSIFPFFVLSFLILNLGYGNYLSSFFENLIDRLFHIQGQSAFVIIMSIISGFPSGPKYISRLYLEKKLTKEESNYLLLFTHFANPLFVLGTCGALLHSQSLAISIFCCQLFSNFIVGFLCRPKKKRQNKIPTKEKLNANSPSKPSSLLIALPDAINSAIEVLLFMLGSICFFMFFSKILITILQLKKFPAAILTGILDLTSGISLVSQLPFHTKFIASIMLSFITFGSFSVHLQVMNALRQTDLSYSYFFLGRVIQTAIALVLFFLLF